MYYTISITCLLIVTASETFGRMPLYILYATWAIRTSLFVIGCGISLQHSMEVFWCWISILYPPLSGKSLRSQTESSKVQKLQSWSQYLGEHFSIQLSLRLASWCSKSKRDIQLVAAPLVRDCMFKPGCIGHSWAPRCHNRPNGPG